MIGPNPVPKWNRRRARNGAVAATVLVLATYLLWTRVSALMVLRWFVAETEIPVEIRAASWEVRIGELLSGKIRMLHLNVFYKPLNAAIALDTPVSYIRKGQHWSIRLQPTLEAGKLPAVRGTIDLELDAKRRSHQEGAAVEFHLRETKPLLLENENGSVSAESWKVIGRVVWSPLEKEAEKKWRSTLEVEVNGVKARRKGDARDYLAAQAVKIETALKWPDSPPLPLSARSTVRIEGAEALLADFFADEEAITFGASFRFDGRRFEAVDLSVDKPVHLEAKGSFGEGSLQADFRLRAPLEELVDHRLARWLESRAPLLRRAKARGTLAASGTARLTPDRPLIADARVELKASSIQFPSRDLALENLDVDLPLSLPGLPDWGRVAVGSVVFHSVKLKSLEVRSRLSTEGVDVTTEGESGDDRPIRQSVWGGAIDIAGLYAHAGGKDGAKFTAAIKGGPFELVQIQQDLCVAPSRPLSGHVSFDYPEIVQDNDSLTLIGGTDLVVFNGKAHVGDLHLFHKERNPRLRFDVSWNDLDLHAIGEWTRFGDMRGSLEGALSSASFALTKLGPVPLSYDFTVRGTARGGNKIRFYGRAVDNILELLGGRKQDMPWYASAALNLSTLWRNWMPATADYMGFRARSDGEWTELSTFDPPDAPEANDAKKHYLLRGTAFTIPLNTHGVYPAIMKTDAFQGWLWGMLQYFKGRIKDDKKPRHDEEQTDSCTPPW